MMKEMQYKIIFYLYWLNNQIILNPIESWEEIILKFQNFSSIEGKFKLKFVQSNILQ